MRASLHDAGVRFAHRVFAYLRNHPDRVRRATEFHAIDEVPYGPHLAIPPDIEEAVGRPFTPPAAGRVDDVVEAYWHYRLSRTSLASPGANGFDRAARDDLRAALATAEAIDPAAWREYVGVHRRQQERAAKRRGVCTLMRNSTSLSQRFNIAFTREHGLFDTPDLRHYDTFLLGANSSGASTIISPMRVPVGDYGVGFAAKMLRAANFLVDFAEQDQQLLLDVASLVKPRREIVMERTMRALDGWGPEVGTVLGLQEGFQSMFSTAIMHTAERISGLENAPDQAVNQVCADDLPNQTTLHAGLAFAFPMMVHGVTLPVPNQWTPDRRLELGERCVDRLTRLREITEALEYDALMEYRRKLAAGDTDARPPVRTGMVCPFAGGFRDDNGFVEGLITELTPLIPAVAAVIDNSRELPSGMGRPTELPDFATDSNTPPARTLAQRTFALRQAGVIPSATGRDTRNRPDLPQVNIKGLV